MEISSQEPNKKHCTCSCSLVENRNASEPQAQKLTQGKLVKTIEA